MNGLVDASTVAQRHVAEHKILVDGAEATVDSYPVHEIRVQDYLHLPDQCTFTVSFQPAPPPGGSISFEDYVKAMESSPFKIGAALEIQLTAAGQTVAQKMFVGDIVTLEPAFEAGGASLTVRAYDRSHRLMRSRMARSFQKMTASDIVTKIVREAGLSPKCDSTSTVHEFLHQNNETNLDFIWRLAERIGFEFLVQGDQAIFRKPAKGDEIELEWPTEIRSFVPRMTGVQQVKDVTVRGWDIDAKQAIVGTASSPDQIAETGFARGKVSDALNGGEMVVVTEPVTDQTAANDLAKALLNKVANAYVQADGGCAGNPALRSGATVKVKGVGEHFSGTYRILSSSHTIAGGGTYVTEFSSTAVQTLTGAMAVSKPAAFADQLVVGLVTNNDDPDKMGRVRVKFPVLGDKVESGWARVVVPSAGQERGLMMLPVPDEEVLVGFEHGDTTRPYVLGSLFNGKQKPGEKLAATDGSFGLRSDKKMDVYSKEEVTFQADKTYQITVQGDVTQTFQAKWGVTVTGDTTLTVDNGNITIKASQGNITIQTDVGNIDIKAGGQLNIQGRMVSVNSDSNLSLQANAQASLKGAVTMVG